ncbi:RNA polymerase sigma factor [Thalassobaculum fulvum]|uniref:RNA polymerase sigma factor n=1 Tax=Thalassobaculum fulvum TaxID=1633335 RepID=A0A918XPS3_9PROT|nr:sigma-70 family RNA polymerase sigma factor [Thalassobaculum fulvum]GHD45403.1 RNA polymerase sigma factor [Thalassobaculum fulvum]
MTRLDVTAHLQRLRRYARFLCRNAADADDLVQDTLVKAIARADQFRPEGDLRNWLFSILHNTFVSGTRTAERRSRPLDICDNGDGFEPQPEQEVRLELRRVLAALDRLPVEQRSVIVLVSVEGMTTDEIADLMQLPVGTVRSRLARGREALRRLTRGDGAGTASLRIVGGHDVQTG